MKKQSHLKQRTRTKGKAKSTSPDVKSIILKKDYWEEGEAPLYSGNTESEHLEILLQEIIHSWMEPMLTEDWLDADSKSYFRRNVMGLLYRLKDELHEYLHKDPQTEKLKTLQRLQQQLNALKL